MDSWVPVTISYLLLVCSDGKKRWKCCAARTPVHFGLELSLLVPSFHFSFKRVFSWILYTLNAFSPLFSFFPHVGCRAVAQKNPSVQYSAGVGVNAYVCMLPSFLPQAQTRSTRAVPCSFCPEFEQHLDFLCHLIMQKSTGEASSLGELLQSASISFSIYHQSTKAGEDSRCDCKGWIGVQKFP